MGGRPGAVVIGGDFQGLGVLRSLSRNGVPTFLVDSEMNIGKFSRHRGGYAVSPSITETNGESFVEFLLSLATTAGLQGWMLFPTSDEAVRVLSLARHRLESAYRVPVPDWSTIRVFAEKRRTHELAEQLGIPAPRTRYPLTPDDLAALDLPFPVIVKPLCRDPFYALTKKKAVRADDADELRRVWEWACRAVPPSELMVQELIPGGATVLYSLGCHFSAGELRGHIVARRVRQHPMDFGRATTFAETVDLPELEELGARFLSAAGYEGLAEVEFMFDVRDNSYKLLEVNPRVWGWHTLAGRAGVELPFLFYQCVVGEPQNGQRRFDSGVKWLRPITDVPTAMIEIAHGRLRLGEYLSSIRGPKELAPSLSWDDPVPFLAEFLLIPYLWSKRGF